MIGCSLISPPKLIWLLLQVYLHDWFQLQVLCLYCSVNVSCFSLFRLYVSPKKQVAAELGPDSPLKWCRRVLDHPSPETEVACRTLINRLDQSRETLLHSCAIEAVFYDVSDVYCMHMNTEWLNDLGLSQRFNTSLNYRSMCAFPGKYCPVTCFCFAHCSFTVFSASVTWICPLIKL